MKKIGKIQATLKTNVAKGHKESVPRLYALREQTPCSDEIDAEINKKYREIMENYTLKKCLEIIQSIDNIPDSTAILLYGPGMNGISVRNLPSKYCDYLDGRYIAYEFLDAIDSLLTVLVSEFEELVVMFANDGIGGKETDYERS